VFQQNVSDRQLLPVFDQTMRVLRAKLFPPAHEPCGYREPVKRIH